MPKPILALLLVSAALLGETRIVHAQAAVASYPWCALPEGKSAGARSCYYATWEQCKETLSGIGGLCIPSPYYRGQAAPLPRHLNYYRAQAVPLPHHLTPHHHWRF
jgi:hypothetical protein